jgi:hypothetical protein
MHLFQLQQEFAGEQQQQQQQQQQQSRSAPLFLFCSNPKP